MLQVDLLMTRDVVPELNYPYSSCRPRLKRLGNSWNLYLSPMLKR